MKTSSAAVALALLLIAAQPSAAGAQSGLSRLLERAVTPRGAMPPRWPRMPTLDLATSMSGLAELERMGRTGEGAAVCVVDGGVDVSHDDFRDAEGRSRALYVLDLGAPPRGAHPALEARCGCAVYSGVDVDAGALVGPLDPSGHGTAVASAAVGDGAGTGEALGPLGGAAPSASLVVVRLPPADDGVPGFADDAIIRGVTACFDAGPVGRTVAVVALGGHDGRHDGDEPIDRALSALAEERGPIVVAAGNDGDSPVHAWGRLRAGDAASVDVLVPLPEPRTLERHVVLSATIAFGQALFVETPNGALLGPVREGERASLSHAGGEVLVDATLATAGAPARSVYVLLGGDEASGTALSGGTYRVVVSGEGRFDAWLVAADVGATLVPVALGGPFVDSSGSVVAVPGTARSVITVGATIARARLDTDTGELSVGGEPGEVASFSSRGPTTDGRPKPDLVAPGAALAVALSGDVDETAPFGIAGGSPARLDRLRVGPDRIAAAGTSLAAPLVAGAIAIAIADEPWRFRSDVDVLCATARPVGALPWDRAGGFGALDALAFVRMRESGAAPSDVDAAASRVVATAPIEVGAPRAWVAGRILGADGPWSGELLLLAPDASVTSIAVGAGAVSAAVPAPRIGAGESIELAVFAGTTRLAPIRFRARWDEARDREPPALGGGGGACAAAPAPRPGGWPVFALLAGLGYSIRIAFRRRVTSRASTSS